MRIHTSDKAIAWITLFSGLTISAVAIYYSVAGLTAIFAAAVFPVILMGVVLEIGKVVTTLWLHYNWEIAPKIIKTSNNADIIARYFFCIETSKNDIFSCKNPAFFIKAPGVILF